MLTYYEACRVVSNGWKPDRDYKPEDFVNDQAFQRQLELFKTSQRDIVVGCSCRPFGQHKATCTIGEYIKESSFKVTKEMIENRATFMNWAVVLPTMYYGVDYTVALAALSHAWFASPQSFALPQTFRS